MGLPAFCCELNDLGINHQHIVSRNGEFDPRKKIMVACATSKNTVNSVATCNKKSQVFGKESNARRMHAEQTSRECQNISKNVILYPLTS